MSVLEQFINNYKALACAIPTDDKTRLLTDEYRTFVEYLEIIKKEKDEEIESIRKELIAVKKDKKKWKKRYKKLLYEVRNQDENELLRIKYGGGLKPLHKGGLEPSKQKYV